MKANRLLLAVFILLLWLQLFPILNYTLDDSFITLRYSQHLAQGYGLVWNVGDPPVEGCTSFLSVLINTFPFFFGLDPLVFIKVVGIASTILTAILLIIYLSQRHGFLVAGMCLLLLSANPITAIHSVNGMETALSAFLLTLFLIIAEKAPWPWLTLIAFLCGLVRPEFNLVIVLVFILKLRETTDRRHFLIRTALPYLALGSAYFIFRWSYFGLPFPLPFYIKQMHTSFLAGVPSVFHFVYNFFPLFLWAGLGVCSHGRLVFAGCLGLVFYFLFPNHIMGDYHRFLYPVYPALCLLASINIIAAIQSAAINNHFRKTMVTIGLGLILAMLVRIQLQRPADFAKVKSYMNGLHSAHVVLASDLAARPKGLMAISDAGVVPFYSGWRTIDLFGLNDAGIALAPETRAMRLLNARPDIIVFISTQPESFHSLLDYENDLFPQVAQAGYQKDTVYRFGDGYFLWLLTQGVPSQADGTAPTSPKTSSPLTLLR